jgi:hypothetical protein
MRRRTLLSAVGATLGSVLLAGCTGDGSPGSGGPTETDSTTTTGTTTSGDGSTTTRRRTTTTGTDDGDDGFNFDPASEDPFESVEVGSRETVLLPDSNRPHGVRVWNDAPTDREMRLLVTTDEGSVLDRTLTFPAGEYLSLRLLEPDDYEVTLFLDGEEAGTVPVGTRFFDCNGSVTNVAVSADGEVSDSSVTTLLACGGPNVAEHSFSVTGAQCGDTNDGTLSLDGETVRLDGHLRTPDPCHGAALSVADHADGEAVDAPSESLTLLVTPTDPDENTMCQQCVGEVGYEGSVRFESEVPETVRLVHESGGERTEVATAQR